MELADMLAEQSVLICKNTSSKRQLFELLAQTAATASGHDGSEILKALSSREDLGSTGLGNGIAIPHGKVPGLAQVVAVFARLDNSIDYDAVDDQPVDIVMMLLAPAGAGADHLKALSRVARLLRTEELIEDVRRASDPASIYRLLTAPVETPA